MKTPINKLPAALAAAVALNACGIPNQSAETPKQANIVRTNVGEALAQIGTDKQGIQAGPNPEMIYSTSCGRGLIEDKTRTDVHIDAMTKLRHYACADDPEAYTAIIPAGGGVFGNTVCERVMTPRTIVCNGQEVILESPKAN